jgi:hypothetical protein
MYGNTMSLRPEYVTNALKFLVTVGVHDGTPEEVGADQKVQFLKDKGLTDLEIREAMRRVRNRGRGDLERLRDRE